MGNPFRISRILITDEACEQEEQKQGKTKVQTYAVAPSGDYPIQCHPKFAEYFFQGEEGQKKRTSNEEKTIGWVFDDVAVEDFHAHQISYQIGADEADTDKKYKKGDDEF